MAWRAKIKVLVLLFLLANLQTGFSQAKEQELSFQEWKELTKDLDYGDVKNLPPAEEEEASEKNSMPWIPKEILQVIVISLVIIGLTILLTRIIGGRFASRKLPEKNMAFSIDEAEEELDSIELNPLLDRFLAQENYRSALRVLYLKCLQQLHRKELIEWKKEKTNFDYVRELHAQTIQKRFEELTLNFEQIWYGETRLDKEQYSRLEMDFKAFDQTESA